MADADLILPILRNIQAELTGIVVRLDRLETRMDRLESRFNAFESRFNAFEARVDEQLDDLEHHAAVTNSKLDAISARLANVEVIKDEAWAQAHATANASTRVHRTLASEIADLRGRVERLEAKDRPTQP